MYWNVFQEDGIWLGTKILTHPSSDSSDAAAHCQGPTTIPQQKYPPYLRFFRFHRSRLGRS